MKIIFASYVVLFIQASTAWAGGLRKETDVVQYEGGRRLAPIDFASTCVDLPADPASDGWTLVAACDDCSTSEQTLAFTFSLFGIPYMTVFVNNNGNLSFGSPFGTYSASGFPVTGFPMVAPFWADVDTIGTGKTWIKPFGTNKLAVVWDSVGYFSSQVDKTNTFQVVISDGTDPSMGLGNNVCFCYKDMQWTTGSASEGVGGFSGVPATVGANKGDGAGFFQFGRFNQPGSAYDGSGGLSDGVDWLDNQSFCFNTAGTNIPPVATNLPAGNRVDLACGVKIENLNVVFLAPEGDQTVSVTASGASQGLTVSIAQGTATINWAPTAAATVAVTLTGTDSLGASTVETLTFTSPGPCPPTNKCSGFRIHTPTGSFPLTEGMSICPSQTPKWEAESVCAGATSRVVTKLYNKSTNRVVRRGNDGYKANGFYWNSYTNTNIPTIKRFTDSSKDLTPLNNQYCFYSHVDGASKEAQKVCFNAVCN